MMVQMEQFGGRRERRIKQVEEEKEKEQNEETTEKKKKKGFIHWTIKTMNLLPSNGEVMEAPLHPPLTSPPFVCLFKYKGKYFTSHRYRNQTVELIYEPISFRPSLTTRLTFRFDGFDVSSHCRVSFFDRVMMNRSVFPKPSFSKVEVIKKVL